MRPRAARPRPAGHRRARRLPAAARAVGHPDHRRHRARRRDRPRDLLELGADDYVVKPLRVPRAPGTHPRGPAADRRRPAAGAARCAHRRRAAADRHPHPQRDVRRASGRARRPRNTTSSSTWPATQTPSTRASRSSRTSGTTTGGARRRRSTSTSPHCARSSRRRPSRRCAAWGSASSTSPPCRDATAAVRLSDHDPRGAARPGDPAGDLLQAARDRQAQARRRARRHRPRHPVRGPARGRGPARSAVRRCLCETHGGARRGRRQGRDVGTRHRGAPGARLRHAAGVPQRARRCPRRGLAPFQHAQHRPAVRGGAC